MTGKMRDWGRFSPLFAFLLLLAAPAPPPLPVSAAADALATLGAPVRVRRHVPKPPVEPRFVLTSVLMLDTPLHAGQFAWSSAGTPAGRTTIVVDLAAQQLYFYRDGAEIGRSSIIYGADTMPTPTGTFPILEKDKDHISNLYFAPMPYMLRLTMDGVSIHASKMNEKFATHGCIGVPTEFAARLFKEVKPGDDVIVTNKWMPQIYWANPEARPHLKPHLVPTTLI
jgi:lipoprotein-anchoring transpeptidase ErfK/SrfK